MHSHVSPEYTGYTAGVTGRFVEESTVEAAHKRNNCNQRVWRTAQGEPEEV